MQEQTPNRIVPEGVFDARFVIDGAEQDVTPRELLTGELAAFEADGPEVTRGGQVITDERVDPRLSAWGYKEYDIPALLGQMAANPYGFSLLYPEAAARLSVASAVISSLWREGHFTYDDLSLSLEWHWNFEQIGAAASFYRSCEAIGDYVSDLRLDINQLSCEKQMLCDLLPKVVISASAPASSRVLSDKAPRSMPLPSILLSQKETRLIYLPFDTADFTLGGSLLSKICGNPGDGPVEPSDGDYLMDCYEIVREMVEDGVVKSGVSVGRGGLMSALTRWCGGMAQEGGADIDIVPLMKAYGMGLNDATDRARVLFGEVPGVLLQISEEDADYFDAQCLLQDVAYYDLGRPSDKPGVHLKPAPGEISALIQSLLNK
ncbi:MAG: hypothetical protein J6Y32_07140 [Bacteroidales bacterium]|nr:hypothetical protein [Bacteroidales bacterium]